MPLSSVSVRLILHTVPEVHLTSLPLPWLSSLVDAKVVWNFCPSIHPSILINVFQCICVLCAVLNFSCICWSVGGFTSKFCFLCFALIFLPVLPSTSMLSVDLQEVIVFYYLFPGSNISALFKPHGLYELWRSSYRYWHIANFKCLYICGIICLSSVHPPPHYVVYISTWQIHQLEKWIKREANSVEFCGLREKWPFIFTGWLVIWEWHLDVVACFLL